MVDWGGTTGHMQVGIEVRTSAYDWTTPTVDVYVDLFVRTVSWGANDDQHMRGYANGGVWYDADYHINSPSGTTTELYVGTFVIGGQGLSYGGGPYYVFRGEVSGSNLGGNPAHEIGWYLPAKPPGPPTPPGVSVSNISATDALLTVTASTDHRGSPVHTYHQRVRNAGGAVIKEWNGGTGYMGPLAPNSSYYGEAEAINYVGSSGFVNTGWFTTANIVPNAPQSFAHGLEGPDSVPLTWAAPVGNGGTPVTSYAVEASTDPAFGGTPLIQFYGNVLAATFPGLTPGLTYYFRVRAGNAQGVSAWTAPISAVTLATNTVKVPGVGWRPVRAWVKVPLVGWKTVTVWKRPAGSGGVYRT